LRKLTEQRLAKFGNTIFHLEPNVKEAPGGLRDFHASAWIRYLACGANEPMGPEAAEHRTALKAAGFVSEVRCFLHYANGRNDNTLTYELQLAAAERSLGTADGQTGNRCGVDAVVLSKCPNTAAPAATMFKPQAVGRANFVAEAANHRWAGKYAIESW